MILAVDIGNTHTVFGIYDKKKLLGDWRVTSFVSRTEDEFGALVRTFCDDAGIRGEENFCVRNFFRRSEFHRCHAADVKKIF